MLADEHVRYQRELEALDEAKAVQAILKALRAHPTDFRVAQKTTYALHALTGSKRVRWAAARRSGHLRAVFTF